MKSCTKTVRNRGIELWKKKVIVGHTAHNIMKQTRWGLSITPTIKEFNGVRLTIYYEITDACTKELRSFGTSSHCFLGIDGLPLRLKKTHLDFYERLLNFVI